MRSPLLCVGLRLGFRYGLGLLPGFRLGFGLGLGLRLQLGVLARLGLGSDRFLVGLPLLGLLCQLFGQGPLLEFRLPGLLRLLLFEQGLALGVLALRRRAARQFGLACGSGFLLALALLLLQRNVRFFLHLGRRRLDGRFRRRLGRRRRLHCLLQRRLVPQLGLFPRGVLLCHCTPKYRKVSNSKCVSTASANARSVPRSRTGS